MDSKRNNSSNVSSSSDDDDSSNLGVHNKERNEQLEQMDLTYLDIFSRPSYRDTKKRKFKDGEGFAFDYKKSEDFSENISVDDTSKPKHKKENYDFPVGFLGSLVFSWTRKVIRAANNFPQLEISHLGKFSTEYYPSTFLNDIKPRWIEMSKKTKSSPLIKTLISGNKFEIYFFFNNDNF